MAGYKGRRSTGGTGGSGASFKPGALHYHAFLGHPMGTASMTGVALATNFAGRLLALPDIAGEAVEVDRLAVLVSTALALSGGRVALYDDNGSFYPGALLCESSELSSTSTGWKESTVSQALTRGQRFWRVLWWAVGGSLRGHSAGDHRTLLGHAGAAAAAPADPIQALEKVSAYVVGVSSFGASHPTFPAGAALTEGRTGIPHIFTRHSIP